jgi:hypothetical protein
LQVGVTLVVPLLAIDAIAAPQGHVDEPPERRAPGARTGPAAALGIRHGYGLLGLQLSFPVAVSRSLALGPFVGVGGFPPLKEAEGHWTVAGGLLSYWGTRHRLFAELSLAPVAIWTLELHGTLVATQPGYGPAAIVGYEFVAHSGFLVRTGGGAGLLLAEGSQVVPLLSVGLGWKW